MRAIFISYRRDDSEGQAGRLYDDLTRQFGDGSVFMDVAGIDPGLDFRKVIDKNVSSCGVLLALIGQAWLDAKDETGARRLDNPVDFVRLETAAALKRDIPVVPVLVAKARMPRPEQLPDDLKELAYRNGVELTHARWDTDVQVLVKALQRYMDNPPPEGERSPVQFDRAQDRGVKKTTAPAESEGAGTLPPDGSRPATKSWHTLVVAAVAAVVIAAGVGYALYEYKTAAREEEAKVRQAAADAAARQLAKDEKAAGDREAARKATADREAAQKAAADKEAARKAAADREAAQKAAADREAAQKAAADREAAQKAAVEREAAQKAAADREAAQKAAADREAAKRAAIPNFAGTWVEINPPAYPRKLQIAQNGSQLSIGGQGNERDAEVIIVDGRAKWSHSMACAPKWRSSGYNYDGPGLAGRFTSTLIPEGSQLLYVLEWNWTAPCGGRPIGTTSETVQMQRAYQ